ncbi:MAG: Ig-like domain-containing protein [Cyclobacteriaceae bacterium]|nr:Ig-like domain-containing protein [Cyclobacteriaceae bacterium]
MRKWAILVVSLILSFPLWQCANQTTPMGGPKDTIPPKLIKSNPEHKQKNFDGKTVDVTFDEYVTLFNAKDEILISPQVGKEVDFKFKKNTVSITPKAGWQDSTTYTIAFREGVKDLTEGNPPVNLRLAFSTGPNIDSSSIVGKVRFALTEKIPDKITVAIYQADTFDIFEHTPTYFTITDKKGKFSLENIKDGTYRIYAFDDKNKNLKVESRSERFGFLSQSIDLHGKSDSLTIPLVTLDTRPPKLNSTRNSGLFTRFAFNKAVNDYDLTADTNDSIIHSYGANQSEVILYNPKNIVDSISVTLHAVDSVLQPIDTIIYIKSVESNFIPEDFQVKGGKLTYDFAKSQLQYSWTFNKPLTEINYDSIIIKTDSSLTIPTTIRDFRYEPIHKKLQLNKDIHKDTLFKNTKFKTELYLGQGAFLSIESDSSKQNAIPIPLVEASQAGTLLVETQTKEPHYIIQLLTSGGELIQEVRDKAKYSFNFLSPQNYKIRVVIDTNNNGKWDAGNIFKNEEPEHISFYITQDKKYEVPIRANWELGPLMLIF